MKLLAYAAPTFVMAFLILVALLITGCTEIVRDIVAPRNGLSSSKNAEYSECIGNCNGEEKE